MNFTLLEQSDHNSPCIEFTNGSLKRGEKIYVYIANVRNSIMLKPRVGKWSMKTHALVLSNDNPPKQTTRTIAFSDENRNHLYVHLDCRFKTGIAHREVMLYSHYWLVNKTGKQVNIRTEKDAAIGMYQWGFVVK